MNIMETIIRNLIKGYIGPYSKANNTDSSWQEPLVEFADAKDELFLKLKDVVSPTHAVPQDFLEDAETIIAYFIPFQRDIVQSNIEGYNSSRKWAVSYVETNEMIKDLNTYLRDELEKLGYRCAVIPPTHNFDKEKLISDWSHRHAAYIAGLGRFGLNNMLITDKGCCGRFGSIITNAKVKPSERPTKEFCLYKYNGSCKKCVERCVGNALSVDGFDRFKCYELCLYNDRLYSDIGTSDVCGKCVVNVPCSYGNPVR